MDPLEYKSAFGKIEKGNSITLGQYYYFIPNNLPPKFNADIKMITALEKASVTLGKLSGACLQLPNPDLLIMPYLKKEALMSSRIEGTRISLGDLLISEAEGKEKAYEDTLEVINYVDAINYGLDKISNENITEELLKEMHRILLRGTRGEEKDIGKYRQIQNWIGSIDSKIDVAQYVPPKPELVSELMKNLIEFLNTKDDISHLIKCAMIHYQFETIHPFCDGNGRIGRTLITLYLCKHKLMIKPLLYISGFFEKYRPSYVSLLLDTNKNGKFEDWILFFLDAVKVQSEDALNRAMKLQKLRETYRQKIQETTHNANMLKLIDYLFVNPYIKITTAKKHLNVTYPPAKRLIEQLVKQNILKLVENSEKLNKTYVAHELLEVISN